MGVRAYVVGDVHGRADLLEVLLDRVVEDSLHHADGPRYLIFLGDYVDRGPAAREVLDILINRPPLGFSVVHLKGNHEAVMLGFLYNEAFGQLWLANGGIATLMSYGVRLPTHLSGMAMIREVQRRLQDAIPMDHVFFLSTLKTSFELGNYLFVHAGIRPGVALARQRESDLIEIREEFLDSDAWHGKVVVHGHSAAHQPVVKANRIGIDTGAFQTGRLTCLVLDGADRSFITTG